MNSFLKQKNLSELQNLSIHTYLFDNVPGGEGGFANDCAGSLSTTESMMSVRRSLQEGQVKLSRSPQL